MPYYITVSKGPRADLAEPVLALSDPRAVQAVLRAVRRLVADGDEPVQGDARHNTGRADAISVAGDGPHDS